MTCSKLSRNAVTSLVLCLTLIFLPVISYAEPKKLTQDGKEGIWFPLESAQRLLKNDIELPKIKEKLELLQKQLQFKDSSISLYKENLSLEKTVTERALKMSAEEKNRADELQDKLTAWYRSPILWFAVGVVVTTAATVTVAVVIDRK